MVIQKPFISNDHANSRTIGQRHITTGLSGAHRERWGPASGIYVKGQYHEKGRWQGPQIQPWTGFGASGRSYFILLSKPETAMTVDLGQVSRRSPFTRCQVAYSSVALGTDISVEKMTDRASVVTNGGDTCWRGLVSQKAQGGGGEVKTEASRSLDQQVQPCRWERTLEECT